MAEDGDLFSIRAASVCGGCWEVLPDICRCGAVRMCGECAEVVVAAGAVAEVVAEPGSCKADMGESGGEDGDAREGVTVDMVRLEWRRMAANSERTGSLGQGLGGISGISARLHEMKQNIVTGDVHNRLFDRIRQLEVGVDSAAGMTNERHAFEGDVFDAYCEHTDDEWGVSDYDYFDGDGNDFPSEDEHAEFEG